MHNIQVEHVCGCFKRSDLESNLQIENKDDALAKAMAMTTTMNEDFCGKHDFQLVEDNNNFVISFKQEAPTNTTSGCCGGGCGSH
ncbi:MULTISPECIES: hypothetical protein [unclassified Arcobacter]|jgi:hypothetical protein|uniref:hypothetical protein n=1 Tax=Arcobacter TaxID=28196 RepID=UPI0035D4A948|tara:strand:+ start:278 stop:532 length:255 start_codon:yes stop_codon:yes gene_type:complete